MIEIKNLFINYEKEEILKYISFSAKKGSILCILGENGAGKSTLLKSILKFINIIISRVLIKIKIYIIYQVQKW